MFVYLLRRWKLQSTSVCGGWFRRTGNQIDVIALLGIVLKAAQVGSLDRIGSAPKFGSSIGWRRDINQLHKFAAVCCAGPAVTGDRDVKVHYNSPQQNMSGD